MSANNSEQMASDSTQKTSQKKKKKKRNGNREIARATRGPKLTDLQAASAHTLMNANSDGDRFDFPSKERHGMAHGDNSTMLFNRVYTNNREG